jgi:hypothetical protein
MDPIKSDPCKDLVAVNADEDVGESGKVRPIEGELLWELSPRSSHPVRGRRRRQEKDRNN